MSSIHSNKYRSKLIYNLFQADVKKKPRNFRKRLKIGTANRRSIEHQQILKEIWFDKSKLQAVEMARKSFQASKELTHTIQKLQEKLAAENFGTHQFNENRSNNSIN